jgi:hypothetical protein
MGRRAWYFWNFPPSRASETAMPYRDDQAALEARRDDLRRELDEITEKAEQLRAAVRDQDAVARELAETEARLARMKGRRVPLLEDVRVASPCTVSWEAMSGDDRVRFCGQCEKNVYNLSAMARAAAERLLAEREASICVRLYRRADGTVLTADCPVGLRKKRVRRAVASAAGASVMAASVGYFGQALFLQGDVGRPRDTDRTATMGMMARDDLQHYADAPLAPSPRRGLVLSYWRDDPAGKRPRQWWKLYADGRVVHEVGPEHHTSIESDSDTDPAASSRILRLAAELEPRAVVITDDVADSAVFEGFSFYGNGQRRGTVEEARAIHEDVKRILAEALRAGAR